MGLGFSHQFLKSQSHIHTFFFYTFLIWSSFRILSDSTLKLYFFLFAASLFLLLVSPNLSFISFFSFVPFIPFFFFSFPSFSSSSSFQILFNLSSLSFLESLNQSLVISLSRLFYEMSHIILSLQKTRLILFLRPRNGQINWNKHFWKRHERNCDRAIWSSA